MKIHRLILLIYFTFMAISGCNTKGRQDACQADGDCGNLQICQSGTCIDVECKQDGDCASGQRCVDNQCQGSAPCQSDADCHQPTPFCDPVIGRCVDCVPDCQGRCCGDDGCGSTCADRCGLTGQTCTQESCQCEGDCIPDCADKQCGPNGCGYSCPPGCGADEYCEQGTCKSLGCQSDQDCTPPTPRCDLTSGACAECLANTDCDGGQICSGGVCADPPSCESSDECEIGQICVDGECLTGCRSDRDCPGDRQCLPDLGANGTCAECEADNDCPAGKVCQEYQCVSHCSEDAHCYPRYCNQLTHQCVQCTQDDHCQAGPGWICLENQCTEGCREDADCDSGHCNPQTHQCIQCNTTDDCPLGSICHMQQCAAGCQDSRDCPGELQCDPDLGDHGACVECLSDYDCPEGTICMDGLCEFFCGSDADCAPPEPACDPASGTCVACVSNQHCQAGTLCIENACLPGCSDDRDCPADMVCNPDLGQHGGCVVCLTDADCPAGAVCENNSCVLEGSEMVRIPGGAFVMGSDPGEGEDNEMPEHVVTLPTYYIDRTEVTNDQYRACVEAAICYEPMDVTAYNDASRGSHPVVYVTRTQATDFCLWMDKSLPTEARWERAARGASPDERSYPWGDGTPDCARANYSGCHGGTLPVGSQQLGASPEGVFDLAGNVYEWVYDVYSSSYYSSTEEWDDPSGPIEGDYRVVRGGSFDSLAGYLRSANRASRTYDDARADTGFRCAMRGTPTVTLVVTPEEGPYAQTTFTADASGSSDPNHPVDVLEVRFDWDDDGIFDTEWSLAKVASHRYSYNGIFRIRVQLRDPDDNIASDSLEVVAEGSAGWDGTECETDQDCAHGFGCILDMTSAAIYVCRENCGLLLDPTCHIEGQTCNIWFDPIGGGLGSACQPG